MIYRGIEKSKYPKSLRQIAFIPLVLLSSFCFALAARSAEAAPTLAVASVSGQAGGSVNIPITFSPTPSPIVGIQFDLTLDAGLSSATVTAGSGLSPTATNIYTNPSPLAGNVWRFLITTNDADQAHLNTTLIPSGLLLTAQMNIAAGVSIGTALHAQISNITYVDNGNPTQSIQGGASTGATVTVIAPISVSVVVNPSSIQLPPAGTELFTAIVTGNANTAVTWSNSPSNLGSINTNGLYTAPASITSVQTVTITATSAADPTKSNTAMVTLSPLQNQPPLVNLTAPANGAVFAAPATINLAATASDSDGSIAQVAFYQGTTLLATDTNAPYTFSWTNVPAGTYQIKAQATDNNGATTISGALTVLVNAGNNSAENLPDPKLNLPAYIPINGSLALEYPAGYPDVQFNWTITATNGASNNYASSSSGSRPGVAGAPSANFKTSSNVAPLAVYGLQPGLYTITVQAFDGSNTSALEEQSVTLVSADFTRLRVYPNPWRSDKHTGPVTFDHMPMGSMIKIFTISGHWIKTLTPTADAVAWDLTNNSGDKVASGVYVYLITVGGSGGYTATGQKTTGQVVVIK